METSRDLYWDDFDAGEVHIRDQWQFELKSEFFPTTAKSNEYTQEFYFFIPNALQINEENYSKQQFYLDQTNLFRYKTPIFTFKQLLDPDNEDSPLTRLVRISRQTNPIDEEHCSDELKLLANIIRSSLRNTIKELHLALNRSVELEGDHFRPFIMRTDQLLSDIQQLQEIYFGLKIKMMERLSNSLLSRQFTYIEEFIGDAILHYLSRLLEEVRSVRDPQLQETDEKITAMLLKEKKFEGLYIASNQQKSDMTENIEDESIVYRTSLLNKFVISALQLTTKRFSMDQKYQHLISGISAGIAMLIYFCLFVWLGTIFVINSEPFIMLIVIVYVLKDRIKDWLRTFSFFYLHTLKWFPDYTTIIQSPDRRVCLGKVSEFFSFIDPEQLAPEIGSLRHSGFHNVLETYQRPEQIIFYKRIVTIHNFPKKLDIRRCGLNIIFRFNVHQFLHKASDPNEVHLTLDPLTKDLVNVRLPKVYHLNMIIRTGFQSKEQKDLIEIKKIRLIIDRTGIRRIEQLHRL